MTDSFTDRFTTVPGALITRDGNKNPVRVNLYWSSANPLSYVVGIRQGDQQEAWEVARDLFSYAGMPNANGAIVGGGDFAFGYHEHEAVFWFKPAHEHPSNWVHVSVAATYVRQFHTDVTAATHWARERDVIERQIDDAIAQCLAQSL